MLVRNQGLVPQNRFVARIDSTRIERSRGVCEDASHSVDGKLTLVVWVLLIFCFSCFVLDGTVLGQVGAKKGIPNYRLDIEAIEGDPANAYSTLFLTLSSLKNKPATSEERFDIVVSFVLDDFYSDRKTSVTATVWLKPGQNKGTCRIAFPMIGLESTQLDSFAVLGTSGFRSNSTFRMFRWSVARTGGGESRNWSGGMDYETASLKSSGLMFVTNEVQPRKLSWFMDTDGDSLLRVTNPTCVPSGDPVPSFKDDPVFGKSGELVQKVLTTATAPMFDGVTLQAVSGICMPVEKLPESLSEYGQTKLFLIEHTDWKRLQMSYPDKLSTLLLWVEHGGALTIFETREKIAKPDSVFDNQSVENNESWTYRNSAGKSLSIDSEVSTEVAFAERRYFNGKVSLVNGDLSRFAAKDWRMLRNSRPGIPIQSDGLGNTRPGFKIPGIGEPPVVLFLILIVIFVVLIGPVNYVLLRKQKRLSLLLITVPTLSILVCASLYLYVWIQEGFGLNTRIRSISYLDQGTGRYVSLSRHQCLGATIPANGYQFDKSDLVRVSHNSDSQELVIRDLGDSFSFNGGDIRPRIEHQVIRKSYGNTLSRIVIATDGQGNFTAENRFSNTIEWLVVSKGKRRLVAKSAPPGQTVPLTEVTSSDRQAIRQMWMTVEKDVDPYSTEEYYADTSDSRVENRIGSVLNEIGVLKDESYIAIFDGHFELSPPVTERVTLRRGYHVLVGRLK